MSRPRKLSPNEAKRILLLILEEGRITFTDHCKNDSMPKRNVTSQDVEHLFEYGEVSQRVVWSDEYNDWKYKVEGTDIDGEELFAITVIIEANLMARVITVF